ncbi:MAG: redoxin domain-containing protein [Planctomycetes bacterium]|nr:redoxin domain-containing protein [Planctomycetota bacterium]
MRDSEPDFTKAKVDVYGLSFDDVATQAKFHAKEKLSFRLLSDPDGSVVAKYDAAMQGRPFAKRVTILIDAKGIVRAIDNQVDVRNHGTDVLEKIRELRASDE